MDASVWETDERGERSSNALFGDLAESRFYLFDAEALLALSHAIEDLALDEANGRVLAVFPEHRIFESLRERYWQLAATIERTTVALPAVKPRRYGRVKFIALPEKAMRSCWLVTYEGRRAQSLVLCRQANEASAFEDRRYLGFYTLHPWLVERVRADAETLLRGGNSSLNEFARLQAVDQLGKRMRSQLSREEQALETALKRLQTGERYQSRNFERDFDKSLGRLRRFKDSVSLLLHSRE